MLSKVFCLLIVVYAFVREISNGFGCPFLTNISNYITIHVTNASN